MRSYVSLSFSRASCAIFRRKFLRAPHLWHPTDTHDQSAQPRELCPPTSRIRGAHQSKSAHAKRSMTARLGSMTLVNQEKPEFTGGDGGGGNGGGGGGGMREAAKELIWSGWPAIVLEPNDTLPMKVPVTRKPPTSSRCAMPLPQALSVPPSRTGPVDDPRRCDMHHKPIVIAT